MGYFPYILFYADSVQFQFYMLCFNIGVLNVHLTEI